MTAMRKIHYFDGFSNESDQAIFTLEEDYGAHHYKRIRMVVRHAKGAGSPMTKASDIWTALQPIP